MRSSSSLVILFRTIPICWCLLNGVCLVLFGLFAQVVVGEETFLEEARYQDEMQVDEDWYNEEPRYLETEVTTGDGELENVGCCDLVEPGCSEIVSEDPFGRRSHGPIAGFGAFAPKRSGPSRWDQFCENIRLHHSSTDGRTYGPKPAIQGTSWLNRPFYIGSSIGGFFMSQGVQNNVRNDNDIYAALHVGWDWDFYWGLEGRIGRSSPEMVNQLQPTAARRNGLLITDLSLIYYPTGDTKVRPYLRAGVGWTDFDFIDDNGNQIEASPFTIPLSMGVKWPVKRWLAARLELTDNITFGDSAVNTHQNFTLVFGLEYRFGARPRSYWPWNPSRHLR